MLSDTLPQGELCGTPVRDASAELNPSEHLPAEHAMESAAEANKMRYHRCSAAQSSSRDSTPHTAPAARPGTSPRTSRFRTALRSRSRTGSGRTYAAARSRHRRPGTAWCSSAGLSSLARTWCSRRRPCTLAHGVQARGTERETADTIAAVARRARSATQQRTVQITNCERQTHGEIKQERREENERKEWASAATTAAARPTAA